MFKQVLLAIGVGALFAAGPCMAHAKLRSSLPADNAQLAAAPTTLVLKFTEAAQLAVLKLVSAGKEIPIPLDKSAKASDTFSVPLPALAAGSYSVQWTVVAADDGHVTKGTFSFAIGG